MARASPAPQTVPLFAALNTFTTKKSPQQPLASTTPPASAYALPPKRDVPSVSPPPPPPPSGLHASSFVTPPPPSRYDTWAAPPSAPRSDEKALPHALTPPSNRLERRLELTLPTATPFAPHVHAPYEHAPRRGGLANLGNTVRFRFALRRLRRCLTRAAPLPPQCYLNAVLTLLAMQPSFVSDAAALPASAFGDTSVTSALRAALLAVCSPHSAALWAEPRRLQAAVAAGGGFPLGRQQDAHEARSCGSRSLAPLFVY